MKTAVAARELAWSDDRLVRECCRGNEAAWSALIEKYKNLIFSVPIKFGLSREDAADIFQSVCIDLLAGLPNVREVKALPKWLMQTAYHQCLRWKKDRLRLFDDAAELEEQLSTSSDAIPEAMFSDLQREQAVRDAMSALPVRCHRMVSMLFFEDPPRPYDQVATELHLATGSIGFIRGRCLKKLRHLLEAKGFQ